MNGPDTRLPPVGRSDAPPLRLNNTDLLSFVTLLPRIRVTGARRSNWNDHNGYETFVDHQSSGWGGAHFLCPPGKTSAYHATREAAIPPG